MTKKLKLLLFLFSFFYVSFAQDKTVTGKVADADGKALAGISVNVKGSNKGVKTDSDGSFSISMNTASNVLQFTGVGFVPNQFTVTDFTSPIAITLTADVKQLEDVVVIGYGTQKKSDVTGSIAKFSTKDLETMPQTNIQQALQGRIAGLSVSTLGASAEGGNLSLQVRGVKSIGAGNNPLIVLDGVIFSNSFSEINPDEIASIEVLKDASSTAIYGARAANGVILITTKKGKTGKAVINYNNFFSFDQATDVPKLMSGARFYELKTQRFGQGSITATEQAAFDAGLSTDWVGLAMRNGFRQQHNVSVSGGFGGTHYFFSVNGNMNDGVSKNDKFNRYTLRLNLDSKIGKNITIGTNTQMGLYDRSGVPASFAQAFQMNPLTTPFNTDGSINLNPWPDDAFWFNPLQGLNVLNNDYTRSLFTNNYIQVQLPVKGLSYKLNTGYTYRNQSVETYYGRNTRTGLQNGGQSEVGNNNTDDWLVENIMNYDRSFGKHTIGVTALYSAQQRKFVSHNLTATGLVSDIQTNYQNGNATTITASDNYDQTNNLSQMGRINYSYDGKYLVTGTVRRDGYSGFGSDTKYGVFPSVGLGWNISEEVFMLNTIWVDNLKLRLSYGLNGNQAIGPYTTLPQLSGQPYLNNDRDPAFGFFTNALGDPSLGWESTKAFNIGTDFSLFNSRLSGSIDYFNTKTSDLLLNRSISPVNGVPLIRQNIGSTKGNGIDIFISGMIMKKKDFSWTADLNFASNRNEIVNVGLTDSSGKSIDDIGNRWFIGQPISVNFSYLFDGIWQEGDDFANSAQPTAKPGEVRVRDVNGDGRINADDRSIIGSAIPKYSAGLTNTFTYKNFSLSIFLRTIQGITRFNSLFNTYFDGRNGALDRTFWTPENPINTYPANRDDANPFQVGYFDEKTTNASFIRLQDIAVSYTVKSPALTKLKIERLQFFFNAKNLATQTSWVGTDPEFANQNSQPLVKSFVLGLRTQF